MRKDTWEKLIQMQGLMDSLVSIMIKHSPQGTFQAKPSTRRVQRWFSRLVEDYFFMQNESNVKCAYLLRMLNAASIEEAVESITKLQDDSRHLARVLITHS